MASTSNGRLATRPRAIVKHRHRPLDGGAFDAALHRLVMQREHAAARKKRRVLPYASNIRLLDPACGSLRDCAIARYHSRRAPTRSPAATPPLPKIPSVNL
jgi:hypothetical protein